MRRLLVLPLLALLLAACGDDADDGASGSPTTSTPTVAVPDRPAEVKGVLEAADGESFALGDADDTYYAGMGLIPSFGGVTPVIVDLDGAELSVDDLADGMAVEVWTEGPCAESSPVQCPIDALRVDAGS